MKESTKQLIQEFCDTQGENYQIGYRYGDSVIDVRGGIMSGEEWEDVANDLVKLVEREEGIQMDISYVGKNGFDIQTKE